LLKTLSGGDTLIGGKLYHDDESFTPTHTLFITTNDRPKLPPTAAFKGRLVFVPFEADFTNSKDMTLEADLKREGSGILWKLLQITPAVFERGVEPPLSVLDASEDVLAENDTAKPFIDECLMEDTDAVTPVPDIQAAVQKWIGKILLPDNSTMDRIMDGVRARWSHGRKWIGGRKGYQVRGLLGVRLRREDDCGS